MSFTPKDQLLETPLYTAANALENLAVPIRNRLKNPDDWSDEHLVELSSLLIQIIELERELRLMLAKVS